MPDSLQLVYWDNPVLSQVCDQVEENEFGPQLVEFGRQLLATMVDKNGAGLAAPQVGITKRIFAMEFPDDPVIGSVTPIEPPLDPIVVANPVLVLDGRPLYGREGCLSLPGVYEQVCRAELVTMKFRNLDGTSDERVLANLNARVAQHEFDHLNGIMFFNYADKRPKYGARMSKQVSKQTLRMWDKEKSKRGL